ncbi:hypothetical protein K4L06_05685 [Lysobacter sp. BMK333-48F3]|uniref:hypothetical protein n=1 Tax=Lysobacter sp. BMK333-48F3 TaxID=2867962 RepID=UPI001C8CDA75|nr:hypothetical protein [Lysobacter sp. BMK333-48F3]MBX9400796.1 hypothetical protein [Lysobacter sp. BMK333-48F3]
MYKTFPQSLCRRTLLFLVTMFTSTLLLAAPVDRPKAGTDVDETRTVTQRSGPPADCLATTWSGVTVLLDRQELARKAAVQHAQWTTEAERLALIEGRRASALLSAAAAVKSKNGCVPINGALDGEATAIVLAALESGSATVLLDGSKVPVAAVAIRYLGTRCGPLCSQGHIMVYVPGQGRPFLVQDWWVS